LVLNASSFTSVWSFTVTTYSFNQSSIFLPLSNYPISRVYHFLPPFTISESTSPTRQIPVFIGYFGFLTFLPTPANWLVGLFTLLHPYFMSDLGPIPRSLVSIISHYLDFDSGRFFFSAIYACNYSYVKKVREIP
jgi:hypothetical protein